MRCPTSKRLQNYLKLDAKQANLIRKIAHSIDSSEDLSSLIEKKVPATHKYAISFTGSFFNDPYDSHMWRVTMLLHAINEIMGQLGVEAFGPTDSDNNYAPPYEYINTGDTYALTLVYSRDSDALFISSWGYIAERHPNW